MRYKILKPQYFDKFKCIGSNCEDTCCKGWDITIDKKTYKKYIKCKNINMRKKLQQHTSRNRKATDDYNFARFKLYDNKCVFLDENNLCSIYSILGEDSMCYTCRSYPRAYNCVDGVIQGALTLSCIEAARLVLLNENMMEFELVEEELSEIMISENIHSINSKNILEKYFYELREFSITLLQNRKFVIEERLIILGLFFNELDTIEECNILSIIDKYNININRGYYNNILEKISIDNTIEAQFSLLFLLSNNIISNRAMFNERYRENIQHMIEGLELYIDNIENSRNKFIDTINGTYEEFIKDKEYIYENYLVNYIFNNLFPYNNKGNIILSYMNLIVNFVIVKLNIIGMCAYYKNDMNIERLVSLIQNYSKALLHDSTLNNRIYEYLKDNNQNTINHMILMIGK